MSRELEEKSDKRGYCLSGKLKGVVEKRNLERTNIREKRPIYDSDEMNRYSKKGKS